jgi:ABC-type Zn uptake system ZnuABC Zn-binding protein ZnuA
MNESSGVNGVESKFLIAVMTIIIAVLAAAAISTWGLQPEGSSKPTVVVTISPLYLIAKEVLGDKAEIYVLAPAGVDPHHYSPTPEDVARVRSCHLFICVGREEFLGQLPEQRGRREISWGDWIREPYIRIKNDNPHYLWLYPPNTGIVAHEIAKVMSEVDSINKDYYSDNARRFKQRLEDLEQRLLAVRTSLAGKRILLIADHFEPLVEWIGLNITYVVIRGEGALPGPQDIIIAIEKAKNSDLIIVSATQREGDEGRIGRQISEQTGTPVVYLYGVPMRAEDDYFDFIEHNVGVLIEQLGGSR